MRRNLAAAILGIVASVGLVGSAHAQGHIFFNNYGYSTDAKVTYDSGSGVGLNNTFTAGLWYFLGTATISDGTGSAGLPVGWELSPVTAQFATAAPAGYFNGPIANILDYTSGPITFAVLAYQGSTYNTAVVRAHSAAFTLPSIATGQSGASEFGPGSQTFAVLPVPEPSIFALSGIGAAVLMLIRRKK
jgi:hypothetical protein